ASSTLRRSRAFCFLRDCDHRDLHSFPTRRSSDLNKVADCIQARVPLVMINFPEMMRVYSEFKIGEIVENHDPQNIAQKIKSVLNNGRAYYQDELERAAAELCWENEEENILSLFEKWWQKISKSEILIFAQSES